MAEIALYSFRGPGAQVLDLWFRAEGAGGLLAKKTFRMED